MSLLTARQFQPVYFTSYICLLSSWTCALRPPPQPTKRVPPASRVAVGKVNQMSTRKIVKSAQSRKAQNGGKEKSLEIEDPVERPNNNREVSASSIQEWFGISDRPGTKMKVHNLTILRLIPGLICFSVVSLLISSSILLGILCGPSG